MYKSLMEVNLNKHLTDDEYYPLYTKKHIDKGAEILQNLYKYSGGNLEKFLKTITQKGDASIWYI